MDKDAKNIVVAMQQHAETNKNMLSELSDKEKVHFARKGYEDAKFLAGDSEEVWKVENTSIKGIDNNAIPLRIYKPTDKQMLPILFFIHGGGFIAGSLETHDRPLRKIANQSGFIVIAIDYRLAPEHPYPAAINDCRSALEWINNNAPQFGGNRDRIFIGGDSAGGNLATVTALMNRDKGSIKIAGQILIYPNTDLRLESYSWDKLGDKGYILSKKDMASNVDSYIAGNEIITHGQISPLYAEYLTGMPKVLIVTAGYDPLHAEGESYAQKLQEADVEVIHWHYENQIHGFFQFGGTISEGEKLISRISKYLIDSIK